MKTKLLSLALAVAAVSAVAQEAESYNYPFQPPKRVQPVIMQAPAPAPAPAPVVIVNDNHIPVPYPVYIGRKGTDEAEAPKPAAPPAAPASTPAKSAQQQLGASAFVNWLNTVRMVFNTPDGVKFGNSAEMQLVIDPSDIDDAVKKQMAESRTDAQGFTVTHIVVAKVLAPDFDVTEFVEKGRQAIDPNRVSEWRWTITPKRIGTHKVNVTVAAVVEVGGDSAERLVKVYDREVMIIVDTVDAIKYFFLSYWQWLWSAIILPIGLWFWKHRKKDDEKKEEDTDLPSAPTSSEATEDK